MLNKKTAFKPKAAIRRPAPGGSQRPSTTDRSSTNTPAPQESSTSQSQPVPQPAQSGPVSVDSAETDNGTPKSTETPSQAQDQQPAPAPATTVQAQQASVVSTPAAIVPKARHERLTTGSTEEGDESQADIQLEKPASHEAPTVQKPRTSKATAAGTGAGTKSAVDSGSKADTGPPPATTSTTSAASPTEPPFSTQTPTTITAVTPIPTPAETAPAPVDNPSQDRAVQEATVSADNVASEQSQLTTEVTSEPAEDSSQPAKPKRARKRTTAAAAGDDSDEQSAAAPPRKRPRKRAAALPGEEGYQPAVPRATRSRKRSAPAAEDGDEEANGEESTPQPRKKTPRQQREATPPDAENVEIDITQVKMADLAKDMHIGKKFSLHDELMERERAKRLRYNEKRKRQQTGETGDDAEANGEAAPGTPASNPNTSAQPTPAAADEAAAESPASSSNNNAAPIGETYQIINGQIVLDHRSLQVDRHARAREEAGELVEVEENDFTHHTTSATYLRRNLKPQQWTDDETELFYQALQAFGTDFDTICRMFKGKQRKHIKLKFNREERVNPQRINAALVGQKTVSMDMEQYQRATGQEYEPAEAIYAEQKKAEEEFEAKQKALEDEKAEEVRRKKEEVLAQLNSAVDGEDGGGGGGGKKGRKGRKKKGPAVMGL